MGLIRPSVLMLAALLTAPALYRSAIGELDISSALSRYLIAVGVSALLLAALRLVTAGYVARQKVPPPSPASTSPEAEPVAAEGAGQPVSASAGT